MTKIKTHVLVFQLKISALVCLIMALINVPFLEFFINKVSFIFSLGCVIKLCFRIEEREDEV